MKTNYPDSLTIQQYLEGKLEPEVMHQLEKQALDDPFLSDALEGYSTYANPGADLSLLQRQLHERIVHMQENKKVFDLTWQRLSVAAAAAVMFVSAGILFWMNSQKTAEQLASQSHKPVEVNVIDQDSVRALISPVEEPMVASAKKQQLPSSIPSTINDLAVLSQKKEVISPEIEETAPEKSTVSSAAASESTARTMASSSMSAARPARTNTEVSLNELVVGSGSEHPPKSGWLEYSRYLESNTRKFKAEPAIDGNVILSFEVRPDGKITNIKVVKGLSPRYDKEAIRLVQNGSDWTPALDGQVYEARVEVSFQR